MVPTITGCLADLPCLWLIAFFTIFLLAFACFTKYIQKRKYIPMIFSNQASTCFLNICLLDWEGVFYEILQILLGRIHPDFCQFT